MNAEQMKEHGFYKVWQGGGTYVSATFFNPITQEYKTCCVRDYDYYDCSRDNDSLYYMEIDEDVKRKWYHFNGLLMVGDKVEVVKGRKLPVGTVGTITRIYDWKDRYGRVQTTYAVFEDGRKTNIYNCKLKED